MLRPLGACGLGRVSVGAHIHAAAVGFGLGAVVGAGEARVDGGGGGLEVVVAVFRVNKEGIFDGDARTEGGLKMRARVAAMEDREVYTEVR